LIASIRSRMTPKRCRDVRVLREEQRLEPALLRHARDLSGILDVFGREDCHPEFHVRSP
jgi:hypothetical protein